MTTIPLSGSNDNRSIDPARRRAALETDGFYQDILGPFLVHEGRSHDSWPHDGWDQPYSTCPMLTFSRDPRCLARGLRLFQTRLQARSSGWFPPRLETGTRFQPARTPARLETKR